jgi:hypothetical protein
MLATLKIEAIGDNGYQLMELGKRVLNEAIPGAGEIVVGNFPKRAWVAKIVGKSKKYKFDRVFVRGKKDYSQANSVGSRGIYIWYFLEPGFFYEVSEPVSWKNTNRFFCKVDCEGNIIKISEEEVLLCLKKI